MVQALGRALTPLLQTVAQQPQDWRHPHHLQHLDACSALLVCISPHLHKSYTTPWMVNIVGSVQESGNDSMKGLDREGGMHAG